MIRGTIIILLVIFCLLELRFWCGQDSVLKVMQLKKTVALQEEENLQLLTRNDQLNNKIALLKKSPQAIEEQARYELGLVKRGEKYYQVVGPVE